MNEVVTGATQLKDVGIAVIIIVGLLVIVFKLIEKYPEWKKNEQEAKDARAKMYSSALERASNTTAEAITHMTDNLGKALDNLGHQTETQNQIANEIIKTLERHHSEMKDHDERCRGCTQDVHSMREDVRVIKEKK